MKVINLMLEDKEHEALVKDKAGKTWIEYLVKPKLDRLEKVK